jgi:hypothetical protein
MIRMKHADEIIKRLLRRTLLPAEPQPSETTKGNSAIVLALLMANVNSRWWMAQFPVILRGMILPRSVTKSLRVMGFL